MKEHKKFIYHSYCVDENGFSFKFSLDEYEFNPRWSFSPSVCNTNLAMLNELVFNLGMVELISYWKCACPPLVEVHCGSLDEWRINWWKKLYLNGLGEFFHVNKINPDDGFMTIVPTKRTPQVPEPTRCAKTIAKPNGNADSPPSGCLIPVGGGKDSIVTLELLDELKSDNLCYIVGNVQRAVDSAKAAGYPDDSIIQVGRSIDPVLLELNKSGYLNGHTPFSAVIAFSSVIFAYMTGKKYVALSNENSANEGNVSGSSVNHQYSKSVEFERDFREYISRIDPGLPEYFSMLRPWNELQITKRFSRYPKYFHVFQSCNAGTKTNTWCKKCAKCLYVYIMLAAFLDDSTLASIFGADLLDDAELGGMLETLANPNRDKPFECVGTRDEVNYALYLALEKRKSNPPKLLKGYAPYITPPQKDITASFERDNFVPEEFLRLLTD